MANKFSRAVVVSFGMGGWVLPATWAQEPGRLPLPRPGVVPLEAIDVAPGNAITLEPGASTTAPWVAPTACEPKRGLAARCLDRLRFRARDHLIGYPEYFAEPAFGATVAQTLGRQKNKGDVHTFTLYQSDFLAGTPELSLAGARRLSFLSSRLPTWPGPIVVEWTPESPQLGEARRQSIVAALQGAALPVSSERVVLGPSPYRGLMGPDAGNNHDTLIYRDYSAPRTFSLTPTSTDEFGGGAR